MNQRNEHFRLELPRQVRACFLFPGQGSQSVGMMKDVADLPRVRETFSEASDILGQDLWKLVDEGPEGDLNDTRNTQPAMLTADIALYRAWQQEGGFTPACMAGHSLGEYAAVVAAGSMPFDRMLLLVRQRAERMQQASPDGAMAAVIGLDDDAVRQACASAAGDEVLEVANYNAPGQVVISGNRAAVERGMVAAKAAGAKRVVKLPVSIASHCTLQQGAAEQLSAALPEDMADPAVPIFTNRDAGPCGDIPKLRRAITDQLCMPVRWVELVRAAVADGTNLFVECGPGKVLTGLVRRIVPEVPCVPIGTGADFRALLDHYRH